MLTVCLFCLPTMCFQIVFFVSPPTFMLHASNTKQLFIQSISIQLYSSISLIIIIILFCIILSVGFPLFLEYNKKKKNTEERNKILFRISTVFVLRRIEFSQFQGLWYDTWYFYDQLDSYEFNDKNYVNAYYIRYIWFDSKTIKTSEACWSICVRTGGADNILFNVYISGSECIYCYSTVYMGFTWNITEYIEDLNDFYMDCNPCGGWKIWI